MLRKPLSSDLIIGSDGRGRPAWAAQDSLLREYYDHEWGMPIRDEQGLFERISLEAFQSGLSWSIILRKRENFRAAFAQFHPDKVAEFGEEDIASLLENPGIVRNRRKILATINNAQATQRLREKGGLVELVWSFKPSHTPQPRSLAEIPTQSAESLALSKALKREGFSFVGPTTMFALMEAIGMVDTHLIGSHRRGSSGIWTS
ncbi:DNA-3-methyladenine glycosylase I [Corynebacterium callunae]|uniref:DNA-3-methyladenine glycosylase I n=1 Tax=Corynebacterium callunae TaxID=1721 RepID=UPI003981A2C9